MDNRLTDSIVRLETRTRQLLMRHEEMKGELARLREELRLKEERLVSMRSENEELRKKYDHLRMAKYIDMADDDVKDLRGRIRKMVRDIDRCISMLKVD